MQPPNTFSTKAAGESVDLLNVLWLVFGGLWMAAGWLLAAVVMAVTIVGIPWARAAANIALYTLLPFGHSAVENIPVDLRSGRALSALVWRSPLSGCRLRGPI